MQSAHLELPLLSVESLLANKDDVLRFVHSIPYTITHIERVTRSIVLYSQSGTVAQTSLKQHDAWCGAQEAVTRIHQRRGSTRCHDHWCAETPPVQPTVASPECRTWVSPKTNVASTSPSSTQNCFEREGAQCVAVNSVTASQRRYKCISDEVFFRLLRQTIRQIPRHSHLFHHITGKKL